MYYKLFDKIFLLKPFADDGLLGSPVAAQGLVFLREFFVEVRQELIDDARGLVADIEVVGVGEEVALEHIDAALAALLDYILDEPVIIGEALRVGAELEEAVGRFEYALFDEP